MRKSLPILKVKQGSAKKKVPCLYSQKSMKGLYENGAILCSSEKGGKEGGISETERAIHRLKTKFEEKLMKFTDKSKPKSVWDTLSPTRTLIESPLPAAQKGEIQTIPENTEERSTSPTNDDTYRKGKTQPLFFTPKQPKQRVHFSRSQTIQQLSGGSYCTPVGSSDKVKARIVCKQLRSLIQQTEKESEKKIYDSLMKTSQFPDEEPEVPDFEEHAITSQVKKEMEKMKFKNGRRYLVSVSSSPDK